jgi:hypothetical protein
MALSAYCNVTTDLTLFCPEVEKYQNREILKGWKITSGQTVVYQVNGTGQVNMLFDDGVPLTVKTSVATVAGTAATWWYDTDNDILYVHPTGSTDPSASVMETGEDWDTLKTTMRNEASDFMDSVLSSKYSVPLAPRKVLSHTTSLYDTVIRRCCALITCSFIARREHPDDPLGVAWFKEAYYTNPEIGEQLGLLQQILAGDITLQNQTSTRELGSWNLIGTGTNATATQYPILRGGYTGSQFKHWEFRIDTLGAIGTATWKVSFDGGTTFDLTLQPTYDATDDERRFYVGSGVWIEWPAQTYAVDDYWQYEMIPFTDVAENRKVSSSEVYR